MNLLQLSRDLFVDTNEISALKFEKYSSTIDGVKFGPPSVTISLKGKKEAIVCNAPEGIEALKNLLISVASDKK